MRILVLFVTMRQVVKKDHEDILPEKFVKMAKEHKWRLKDKRFQRQGEGDQGLEQFVCSTNHGTVDIMATEPKWIKATFYILFNLRYLSLG